jgi:hypothetical protein
MQQQAGQKQHPAAAGEAALLFEQPHQFSPYID